MEGGIRILCVCCAEISRQPNMRIARVSIYGQVSRTFVLITHTNYLHYLLFSSCLDKLFISSYSIYLYLHRLSPQPVLFASFLCLVISATNGSLHSHRSFFHTPKIQNSSVIVQDGVEVQWTQNKLEWHYLRYKVSKIWFILHEYCTWKGRSATYHLSVYSGRSKQDYCHKKSDSGANMKLL